MQIRKTGPKDAQIEMSGIAMFRYRYFRTAYASLIRGVGLTLAKTFYARQIRANDQSALLALSWV